VWLCLAMLSLLMRSVCGALTGAPLFTTHTHAGVFKHGLQQPPARQQEQQQ
jgi:hypothetical protein